MKRLLLVALMAFVAIGVQAQEGNKRERNHAEKFEQLGQMLRSPNTYRGADGYPGRDYFQQKADYKIKCTLDTKEQRLDGSEQITYYNNSPSDLRYLWVQLDENEHAAGSKKHYMDPSSVRRVMSEGALKGLEPYKDKEKYGVKIEKITDAQGRAIQYREIGTMMRIELAQPLKSGTSMVFNIDWHYYLTNRIQSGGRGGYEHFEDNDTYLYTMTQWFPRMCVYSDFEGWQNKEFVGRGEFALNFGDYEVEMTLPADHIVGSTGECQNYKEMLTPAQYKRWMKAQTASEPIEIVTKEEALANENRPESKKTKTWKYSAKNVRDFAWTASKKFVWDAMAHTTTNGKKVMAMSYYGKEAYPIYNKYSTRAVDHTLEVYSKYTIPYPYPVAISVEAANGMEYPMICFNPGRAEEDGTYTPGSKNRAILVIIHEVGHNYFPMIVNSDERQWTWFDEGLNSYMQFVAEQEWDNNFPSSGGPAHLISRYMASPSHTLEPIMTNSENIIQFGNNAYNKPATALNILRETIMGREAFDYAFKKYAETWAFKHPTPSDFFRIMEDASGVDLDWFWRGWFYGTDPVDIALDSVIWYKVDLENDPVTRTDSFPQKARKPFRHITQRRYAEQGEDFYINKDTSLVDIYTNYQPWNTEDSVNVVAYTRYAELYTQEEKNALADNNYYELHFSNKGGLVMPVIIEWTYKDGTKEIERVPVEIWRKNEKEFRKVFVKDKEVEGIVIDPYRETADIDLMNNNWPLREMPSRFEVFKSNKFDTGKNPMQKARDKKRIKP